MRTSWNQLAGITEAAKSAFEITGCRRISWISRRWKYVPKVINMLKKCTMKVVSVAAISYYDSSANVCAQELTLLFCVLIPSGWTIFSPLVLQACVAKYVECHDSVLGSKLSKNKNVTFQDNEVGQKNCLQPGILQLG